MKSFFKKTNSQGFTLIETLFAVLIFSAALVSLMAIAGKGIAATIGAREQITAHYLAQEGLEVVRNVRDTNYVIGQGWDDGISECDNGQTCKVNYLGGQYAPSVALCAGINCQVWQSLTDGSFVDNGSNNAESSPFTRLITIEEITSEEYLVESRVEWMAKTVPRSVVLRTIIKKWQ